MTRKIALGLLVVVNLILAHRIFFGEQSLFGYLDTRGRLEEHRRQLEKVERAQREMAQEVEWLKSDRRTIEAAIRKEMNYLKDTEVVYLFSRQGEAAPSGQSASVAASQTRTATGAPEGAVQSEASGAPPASKPVSAETPAAPQADPAKDAARPQPTADAKAGSKKAATLPKSQPASPSPKDQARRAQP